MSSDNVHAQPPEKFTGLRIKTPKSSAGGFDSIVKAGQYSLREMSFSRMLKTLRKVNQKDGYDCPGCAWPDPKRRSFLGEFCENGAKAVAEEATQKKVTPAFFEKHSVEEMSRESDFWLGKRGRITEPVVLRKGDSHYRPISWADAFSMVGEHLNELQSPDEAIFYTSGRTSNEAAFLYQTFVREFGTNNLPDCSNMCHESSGTALSETLGIGKGSVTLDDFYQTDLIIIAGQNPGTNHPRMLTTLQKAKSLGTKIITINPIPEAGLIGFRHPQKPGDLLGSPTVLTDLYLQVRINGDVPLLKAINKLLLDREKAAPGSIIDHDFIGEKTDGYEQYVQDLESRDLDALIDASGLERERIDEAVDLIAGSEKIIYCWAMGLTQHKNAVDNSYEIVNLLLLKGSIGKPGAGTCPVRGHSNVQGDRTMGIWESPKPEFLNRMDEVLGIETPRKHGYNTVESIKAMQEGRAKVFISMGGNFLSASPDTEYTAQGLRKCSLTVHVSTKLNRSHLIHGENSLILPCLGRTERDNQAAGAQFVSVENSTGYIHKSTGGKVPASEHLLSEPKVISGMARATLGSRSVVDWETLTDDYSRIRDLIEQVIPGFENYNARIGSGFYLPNGARTGDFNTKGNKAKFTIGEIPDHQIGDDQFLMMTIRSHDQFNTTIYGLDDRYRGIYNERRVVMMNGEDIERMGLREKQIVDLVSHYEGEERIARSFLVVPYNIPKRCIATYFPEANVLVPVNNYARKSFTPASKSVIVSIQAT